MRGEKCEGKMRYCEHTTWGGGAKSAGYYFTQLNRQRHVAREEKMELCVQVIYLFDNLFNIGDISCTILTSVLCV